MKYTCPECSFSTNDNAGWFRHKKTKKHLKLTENIIDNESNVLLQNEIKFLKEKVKILENQVIDKEKQSQETQLILNKQLEDKNKQLEDKNKQLDEIKKELDETKKQLSKQYENKIVELEETKKKLDNQYEKHIDTLKDENIYHKQIINEAGGMVKESLGTLNFVVKNYPNAPPLEKISDYEFMLKDKNKFIKDLTYSNMKKIADEYLGKIIISIYKKDDPKIQSLWSSDVSRLNYVIKDVNIEKKIILAKPQAGSSGNKISMWTNDKNGVKLREAVIKPFLEKVRCIGNEYIEENKFDDDEYDNNDDISQKFKIMQEISDINVQIKNGSLGKDICKIIAPYFQPNKIKQLF